MGKLSGWISTEQPDNGRGVRQGEVDSSDAFAAFVDGLDDEIMEMERRVGRFLGLPLLGGQCGQTRLNVLKHADDTVLFAETEEDLQVLVDALMRWCEKWQVIPNAVKCKCMVWAPDKPRKCAIRMYDTVLENTASYVYLGYRLDNTCMWRKHVDRRVESGDKWDRIVCALLGRRGGLPLAAVAQIRVIAAETSQLYGAELYAEAHDSVMESATYAQVKTARDVLGVRDTAEATGVLLELGWTSVRRKALHARFMLWWRMARSLSPLMRGMDAHAQAMDGYRKDGERSQYNWWSTTRRLVEWLVTRRGLSAEVLRGMPRQRFSECVQTTLWQEEYWERLMDCMNKVRLRDIGTEIGELASREDFRHRMRWPGAPYKYVVDDRYHVRLLALTRLNLLPIEVESGRWSAPVIPREERLCSLGCGCVGDQSHFLRGCSVLAQPPIDCVYSVWPTGTRRHMPPNQWRGTAARLAARWQSRNRSIHKYETEHSGTAKEINMYLAELAHDPDTYERSDIRAYLRMRAVA